MATTSGTAVVTMPADNQIGITREFDAPRHLVWRAMTTPELVKRWWSGDRGEVTSGRANSACALMGTSRSASTSGHTTGPPAEKA